MFNLERTMSRRAALSTGVSTAVGVGSAVLVGCGDEPKTSRVASPTVFRPETATIPLSNERFSQMKYAERLSLLEQRGMNPASYPELQGFQPHIALAETVAYLYQAVTIPREPFSEMAKKVHFLGKEEFLDTIERLDKKIFTPEEREKEYKEHVEATTSDTRDIFIDKPRLDELVEETKKKNPKFSQEIGGKSEDTAVYEYILFHAFTHASLSQGNSKLAPVRTHLPGTATDAVFDTLDQFKFLGIADDNGDRVVIGGANEAITELIGNTIMRKITGFSLTVNDHYANGEYFVRTLNEQAGISSDEFLRYNTTLPVDTLLKKWGALNPGLGTNGAIYALMAIGLYTQGNITFNDAVGIINQNLILGHPFPLQK